MKIIIDDTTMKAQAVAVAEDGRKITACFDIYYEDSVDELIGRATDELSEVYLDMCSPYM